MLSLVHLPRPPIEEGSGAAVPVLSVPGISTAVLSQYRYFITVLGYQFRETLSFYYSYLPTFLHLGLTNQSIVLHNICISATQNKKTPALPQVSGCE